MNRRGLLLIGLCSAVVLGAWCGEGPVSYAPAGPPGPPGAAPARLLVVTHTAGFRHDSIPAAEASLRAIGEESGLFAVEFARSAEDVRQRLTRDGLASVDAVFFANTTGDIGIPDMPAFLGWIAGGKAFLGAHSATDTYHGSPEFLAMIGGEFETHGKIVEAEIHVDVPSHPAVAHLAPRFRMTDEWYRFKNVAAGLTVLLSFDRVPPDGVGTPGEPADLPLAWHQPYGSGRVFYTALGHRAEIWDDPRFRQHLREGIRWALAP